jgi:hypothetical protein
LGITFDNKSVEEKEGISQKRSNSLLEYWAKQKKNMRFEVRTLVKLSKIGGTA